MTEPITQTDLDNLADIIWWIKGYTAGAGDNFESCPFQPLHIESLRKARLALKGDPMAASSPNEADAPSVGDWVYELARANPKTVPANCPQLLTGDGLEKPSVIHERLFNERNAKLQEDAEVCGIPFAARKKREAEDQIKATIKNFQAETGLLVDDVKMDVLGTSVTDCKFIDTHIVVELKVSFGL